MPALIAGAEKSPDKKARITFAASIVQTKGINFDSLKDTPQRKKMCADQRYMQSKFVRIILLILYDIFLRLEGQCRSSSRICTPIW
jgi:retinol dehydrogenase 12